MKIKVLHACLMWYADAMGILKWQASPRAEDADSPSRDKGKSLEVRRNSQGCFSNVNVAERWQTVNEMSPCRLRDNA